MEEIVIQKKAVTPCGDFGCQSFPLIEDNVYHITEEELAKLGRHELKWSYEEYEAEEPIYEEVQETTKSGIPLPPKKVQVGTKKVTKTRPILVENDPSAENLKAEMLARIAELKKQLADTDYEAIKFAEGEMSAEDYAPFKIQRATWRAEINRLEEQLGEKNE